MMYHSLLWYITEVPPLWLEQIFTPFQVNQNKNLPLTTVECNYLLLLLHSICGFTTYFLNYNVLDIFYYSAYRRLLFLANSFVACSTEFVNCTCIDAPVQFL